LGYIKQHQRAQGRKLESFSYHFPPPFFLFGFAFDYAVLDDIMKYLSKKRRRRKRSLYTHQHSPRKSYKLLMEKGNFLGAKQKR
jgi:hypothetical protein